MNYYNLYQIEKLTEQYEAMCEELNEVKNFDSWSYVNGNSSSSIYEIFEKYGMTDNSPMVDDWYIVYKEDIQEIKNDYPDFDGENVVDFGYYCDSEFNEIKQKLIEKIEKEIEELKEDILDEFNDFERELDKLKR